MGFRSLLLPRSGNWNLIIKKRWRNGRERSRDTITSSSLDRHHRSSRYRSQIMNIIIREALLRTSSPIPPLTLTLHLTILILIIVVSPQIIPFSPVKPTFNEMSWSRSCGERLRDDHLLPFILTPVAHRSPLV